MKLLTAVPRPLGELARVPALAETPLLAAEMRKEFGFNRPPVLATDITKKLGITVVVDEDLREDPAIQRIGGDEVLFTIPITTRLVRQLHSYPEGVAAAMSEQFHVAFLLAQYLFPAKKALLRTQRHRLEDFWSSFAYDLLNDGRMGPERCCLKALRAIKRIPESPAR